MKENPFETLEVAMVIVAIVQVIVLVVFFMLAANVAKIKKSITVKDTAYYIDLAKMETYLGNKQSAIDNYMRVKFCYKKEYATVVDGDHILQSILEKIDKAIAELQK